MTATPTTDAAALTDADLAAITARATLATTGPWTWGDYGRGGATLSHDPTPELGFPGHDVNVLKTTDDWAPVRADADFIANARTDIPRLLAHIAHLTTTQTPATPPTPTSPTASGRPSWDEWGLTIAHAIATRADCTRRQVGALIVGPAPERRIISAGYNGAPSNVVGCTAGGCPRGSSNVAPDSSYDSGPGMCTALHAEQNAIIRAPWEAMRDATLYITHDPCPGCARMIGGTPLARVVTPTSTTTTR